MNTYVCMCVFKREPDRASPDLVFNIVCFFYNVCFQTLQWMGSVPRVTDKTQRNNPATVANLTSIIKELTFDIQASGSVVREE